MEGQARPVEEDQGEGVVKGRGGLALDLSWDPPRPQGREEVGLVGAEGCRALGGSCRSLEGRVVCRRPLRLQNLPEAWGLGGVGGGLGRGLWGELQ